MKKLIPREDVCSFIGLYYRNFYNYFNKYSKNKMVEITLIEWMQFYHSIKVNNKPKTDLYGAKIREMVNTTCPEVFDIKVEKLKELERKKNRQGFKYLTFKTEKEFINFWKSYENK